MSDDASTGTPDNPDPFEKLKHAIVKCAEKQKGYDIAGRLQEAPHELLKRMQNKSLDRMRAMLEEYEL